VPDPNGVYSVAHSKGFVDTLTTGTLAHEYQHLINAAQRLYVTNADAFEDTWLNEGLSHIAEELLFYRVTGLAPRQNLDISAFQGTTNPNRNAFNAYQADNFGRYQVFLGRPNTSSPYAGNDSLQTRGATWNLLRYLADHQTTANDAAFWRSFDDTPLTGQRNVQHACGCDYMTAIRDWATSVFSDDVAGVTDPRFLESSWNMRSIFPHLTSGGTALNRFPLAVVALSDASPASISVNAGGAAYIRFTVPAGTSASIDWSAAGLPVSSLVKFTVVRSR
jgi:hypothetical protein